MSSWFRCFGLRLLQIVPRWVAGLFLGMVESVQQIPAMSGGGNMYYNFGTRKIVEAVAVLLKSCPERSMGRMRLLKLLYIADRESLREVRRPIIGTELTSMKWGPLHSKVYDMAKGPPDDDETWGRFLDNKGRYVVLGDDPGHGTLSRYEIRMLQATADKHRDMTDSQLSAITHDFPEYKRNDPGGSSRPIPMHDILEAIGLAEEEGEIAMDAQRVAAFNKMFGVPS